MGRTSMTLLVEKRGSAAVLVILALALGVGSDVVAQAQMIEIPRIPFLSQSGLEDRGEVASSLEILFFLTIFTMAPAIVLLSLTNGSTTTGNMSKIRGLRRKTKGCGTDSVGSAISKHIHTIWRMASIFKTSLREEQFSRG